MTGQYRVHLCSALADPRETVKRGRETLSPITIGSGVPIQSVGLFASLSATWLPMRVTSCPIGSRFAFNLKSNANRLPIVHEVTRVILAVFVYTRDTLRTRVRPDMAGFGR